MAKTGLKKIIRANRIRLLTFAAVTCAINAFSLAVSVWTSGSIRNIRLFPVMVWLFLQFSCLGVLWACGKPLIDDDGLLVDCVDITDSGSLGVYSYIIDLLAILWVTEIGTVFSKKFFILLAIVPAIGVLKLVSIFTPPSTQIVLESPVEQVTKVHKKKPRRLPIRR